MLIESNLQKLESKARWIFWIRRLDFQK